MGRSKRKASSPAPVPTAPADAPFRPHALDTHGPELAAGELTPEQRLRRVSVVLVAMSVWAMVTFVGGVIWGDGMDTGILIMLPLALIPPVRRWLVARIDELRVPGPRTQLVVAAVLAAGTATATFLQGVRVGRQFMPQWHDEHSYLLQAVHLARGRLWYPAPPMADFFESFHMLVEPVYASIYWPGTALMNAPAQAVGLPPWGMPLVLYGLAVAMVYLVTTRLVDGAAGIMAALMVAVVLEWHDFSTRMLAQIPMTLLGGAMIWTWLHWREQPPDRRLRWVALLGALAGWAAITRPVDALAFALPLGLAMLVRLGLEARRAEEPGAILRHIGTTAGVGIAAALPFAALMLSFNYGVTGHLLKPAYVLYLEQSQPGTVYGSAIAAGQVAPTTQLPQKLAYYYGWLVPMYAGFEQEWLPDLLERRLPTIIRMVLPGKTFYAWFTAGTLVALGAYGLLPTRSGQPRRAMLVLLSIPIAFLALYALNPFFLEHYALPLCAAMLPVAAAGVRAVEECAGPRFRSFLVVLLTGGTLAWYGVRAYTYPATVWVDEHEITYKYRKAPDVLGPGRALVLVRWHPLANHHLEPVYNAHVPTPDQARVIYAHELGDRADQILRYYAEHQPDRQVFLWVRPDLELHPLGHVPEALRLFEAGGWPWHLQPVTGNPRDLEP